MTAEETSTDRLGMSKTAIAPAALAAGIWLEAEDSTESEIRDPEDIDELLGSSFPERYSDQYVEQFVSISREEDGADQAERERSKFEKNREIEDSEVEIVALLRKLSLVSQGIDPSLDSRAYSEDPTFLEAKRTAREIELPTDLLLEVKTTQCPKCSLIGTVEPWFGWRKTSSGMIPQSWCRICRSGKANEERGYEEKARDKLDSLEPSDWFALSHWGKKTEVLNGWERQFSYSMGELLGKGRTFTERQEKAALKVLTKALEEGFEL